MGKDTGSTDLPNNQEQSLTPNPIRSNRFFQNDSVSSGEATASPVSAGSNIDSLAPQTPKAKSSRPVSDTLELTQSSSNGSPSSSLPSQDVRINVFEEVGETGSDHSLTSTPERKPQSIELTSLPARSRESRYQVSKLLKTFLEQTGVPEHALNPYERAMLEVIVSPKSWKHKLPTYLSLPVAGGLITKLFFYLSISKKDLAPPESTSVLTEAGLNRGVWLQGQAIPLFTEEAIVRAYRVAGFSKTINWVGGVWLLLYLSLQINALVLSLEYGETDYSLSDIILEPYNIVKLFTDNSQSTKASLTNSLSGYVIWPLLIGVPLLAGLASSWYYGRMARRISEESKEADLNVLRNYTPNAFLDYPRWSLPNHPLGGALTRLSLNLLYNGNESVSNRNTTFQVLQEFVAKAKGRTQIRARELLGSLAFGSSPQNLIEAKKMFPSVDYTSTVQMMGKAYFNLQGGGFSLKPQDHENHLDALLRAGTTRYLTYHQQLGHAGKLMFLFIIYDFYISYGDTSLLLIVLKGMINAIKNLDAMVKCKQDNKVWVWRKESKIYVCSVCGDETELAYYDIWTQESCVTSFLSRLQPAQKIVNFFNNHNLQDITSIDFSKQLNAGFTPYHNADELDAIFTVINARAPKLSNFSFTSIVDVVFLDTVPDSSYAGAPLGRFLANAKHLQSADFSYLCLQANGTIALAPYLNQTSLTSLNYNGNIIGDLGLNALSAVLPQTQLKSLNLMFSENSDDAVPSFVEACLAMPNLVDFTYGASYTTDASASWLSLLLRPGLTGFSVYSYLYTDAAMMTYATQLPQAKNLMVLGIQYYSMTNETTIRALTDALVQVPVQQLGIQGASGDYTVSGLSYFFYRLKDTRVNKMKIAGSMCPDETSTEAFFEYFPLSQVKQLIVTSCFNPALSANSTEQFAMGLSRSNISSLILNSLLLSNGFSGNFQQVILAPQLDDLKLISNDLDESFNLALMELLPRSRLRILNIIYNSGVTDLVINRTASVLSQTHLEELYLGEENITRFSIQRLFDAAIQPESSIRNFGFFQSQLGDEGASYIASRLPGTTLNSLSLEESKISDVGAIAIANSLSRRARANLLWIDLITQSDPYTIVPTSQLTLLDLTINSITATGARTIYDSLHYTNIPPSSAYLSGANLTIDELAQITMASSASRQATIPWPVQLTYMLLITLPHQALTAASKLMGIKEGNNEATTDTCQNVVLSLLFMLLAYKLVLSQLKPKLERSSRFSFFNSEANNVPSPDERSCVSACIQ